MLKGELCYIYGGRRSYIALVADGLETKDRINQSIDIESNVRVFIIVESP